MKTSRKTEANQGEEEQKQKPKSEKKENVLAIAIFVILIIIGIGIFTNGFGLLKKGVDSNTRTRVPLGDDPFVGPVNASVIIIAFSDYECPFCTKAEHTMQTILEKYEGRVVYVFKDFPLTIIHPNAYNASLAAECAKEQDKFWEYHSHLYENNDKLEPMYLREYANLLGLDTEEFNECFETQKYKNEVEKDIQTARLVGVTATPSFFINGIRIVGAKPEEEFTKIINSELETNR